MYLFGIKCPVCQAEKDMPVDEFSFDTREEKTCGIAYAKCMQCDSRFEIIIPVMPKNKIPTTTNINPFIITNAIG